MLEAGGAQRKREELEEAEGRGGERWGEDFPLCFFPFSLYFFPSFGRGEGCCCWRERFLPLEDDECVRREALSLLLCCGSVSPSLSPLPASVCWAPRLQGVYIAELGG